MIVTGGFLAVAVGIVYGLVLEVIVIFVTVIQKIYCYQQCHLYRNHIHHYHFHHNDCIGLVLRLYNASPPGVPLPAIALQLRGFLQKEFSLM